MKLPSNVSSHSDPATKQILLTLNGEMQPPFIVEDLDETHLFIDTDYIDEVMERLDEILEENTYKGAEGEK